MYNFYTKNPETIVLKKKNVKYNRRDEYNEGKNCNESIESNFKGLVIILTNSKTASAALMFIDQLYSIRNKDIKILQIGLPTGYDSGYSDLFSENIFDGIVLNFPIKEFIGRKRGAYESYAPDIAYFLPINYQLFCDHIYDQIKEKKKKNYYVNHSVIKSLNEILK